MKAVKEFNQFVSESSNYDLSMKEMEDGEYVVYAKKNGKEVGKLNFIKSKFKPVLKATNVSVDPAFQRQGIGSSMYVYAEDQLKIKFVKSEDVLTPDGKILWDNPNRKFGKYK